MLSFGEKQSQMVQVTNTELDKCNLLTPHVKISVNLNFKPAPLTATCAQHRAQLPVAAGGESCLNQEMYHKLLHNV